MTDYEIYVFFLCLIVFVILAVLSTVCVTALIKLNVKLIRCGGEDAEIKKEFEKISYKDSSGIGGKLLYALGIVICVVFVAVAAFSISLNYSTESKSDTFPTLRVVESSSMSSKLASNTYLYENDLNDQFNTMDVILTYKMPDEYELELYDIVVYDFDGTLVIHRIIAIEEPNEKHDCRYFTMRGDNVEYSDSKTVTYDMMLGIYRGQRVPYVGSFVMFLQSPAGWLCVGLLVAVIIITPLVENYISREKQRRMDALLASKFERQKQEQEAEQKAKQEQAERANLIHDKEGFYDVVDGKKHKNKKDKRQ